jgi:thiol-disulfide isomerase/thioredoxin
MKIDKQWFNKSNITTIFMVIFIVVLIASPQAKGLLIEGLMKIGLFQPDVPKTEESMAGSTQKNEVSILFQHANGEITDVASLKGKVVFINFWATWCPPCIAEMPTINNLYLKYKDNKSIVFLMVDADGDLKKSQQFMDSRGFSLESIKPASAIPSNYFESSLPTSVVLDKDGNIVFKHEGAADYQNTKFIEFLEKLLTDK